PILADAARLVGDQFAGRCTVDVEVDGLPLVPCDPDLVADAVTNLVLNAAEASPRGGRVVVRARPEGRDVVLTVEDEGPGLPAEVLARLFEPFFTTKPQGNMGLGLVLARSVIEDHGGRIEAANRAQGGAVLTVHLPLETLP
ncbi:MAG TPA: ATP-binding protein, partial [Candidatus Thermoplasmatota archaeon]|nr:ATP-binding protein [Candidatus Thermoplasmatota archaeon]